MKLTYRDAIREALREALRTDPATFETVSVRLGGYTLLNASLRVQLVEGLSVALRGENLLDVCHACHGWIHNHPAISYEHGWMKHREVVA